MINKIVNTQVQKYEVLDYISTNQRQYLDTDIVAQNGIKVEMTTKLTSRPGNTRLFSTHDERDYSGQNWAFASGTWGLQFEGSQMCIKPLGTSANNINSFDLLSYYYNDVQNKKLRYELACSGLLEIYDDTDTLVYTFDSSAKTDLNKVSQTTIRFFGREATERAEWMVGDTYDIKIYDNGVLIRHYIPVKRISDNVIGFYETETETFLTSASGTDFTGTSKATLEYINETVTTTDYVNDIIINNTQINRIYLNGEVYWGNEPTSTPPTERYIPALYCMNNNSSSTKQEDHATFTIPWAPDPSIAHSIDVELVPIAQTSQYYGWSLFFGGNTSTMSHMGNIYGFYSQYTTRICADALNKSMETSSYNINNYLNMSWSIQISNAAEVGGQRNCAATVKAGNDTLINATSVSTRSNWGTFDPYFIFGSQIEHHTTSFGAWQFKLYKFDIYDDNVLVYQLRPYYDTVNQEYGMYDLVNNIFYPSMNVTHSFTGELPQS